jgi:hypothetical protein
MNARRFCQPGAIASADLVPVRRTAPDPYEEDGLVEAQNAEAREPGKDIIAWGGAAFGQSLTRLGLVDEHRLTNCEP